MFHKKNRHCIHWLPNFLPAEVNGLYGVSASHNQPGEADWEASQQRRSLWTEQNLNRGSF